jgi:hypothetical protein
MRKGGVGGNYVSHHHLNWLLFHFDTPPLAAGSFIPDERAIKVQSGNSLVDYLQTELMFKLNSKTIIDNKPQESHKVLNLQLVHFIANFIWKNYEDTYSSEYRIIGRKVHLTRLFFPR